MAAIIERKLRSHSANPADNMLRDYVHSARRQLKPNRAFLRLEEC